MPVVSKETLAMRFRQNWLAKHPVDTQPQNGSTLDDSLTSLNWLHNLNIMKIATPTPPTSPQPADFAPFMGNSNAGSISGYTGSMQVNPNAILNMTGGQSANRSGNFQSSSEVIGNHVVSPASCRLPGSLLDVAPPTAMDKIDYKNNPHVKPPYSYATLICMAMKESKKNKITLAGIYNWITENFMYYRVADPSWQNSIRHNLSLNKCFQKVPRKKDEPGKGGFWRINPEYQDMFVNGVFKKRRGSPPSTPLTAPPIKRLRREEDISVSHILPNASVLLTPGEDYSSLCDIQIKSEPNYDDNTHHRMHASAETALNGDALDFSWGAILNQDIEVGGVKVKTEDIIDEKDPSSPITELSPPPSDHNSDIALEDLLNGDFNTDYQENSNEPVDLSNGGSGVPLDLSIQGVSLKPPEWWTESFNQQMMEAAGMGVPQMSSNTSGLHTPISSSPIHESEISHPWAEEKSDLDQAMASFDAEISSLFHLESVPSVASET